MKTCFIIFFQLGIFHEHRNSQVITAMANGKEPTVSAALCWGSGVRDIVCMNLGVYTLTHASCYVSYILYKSVCIIHSIGATIKP